LRPTTHRSGHRCKFHQKNATVKSFEDLREAGAKAIPSVGAQAMSVDGRGSIGDGLLAIAGSMLLGSTVRRVT